MQRLWSADELDEHWTLGPAELKLLTELTGAGKLGLAAQLAYWRQHGRFPDEEAELAPAVVGHLAAQVGVEADALDGYAWMGRTGRRHRRLILDHLAVAAFDDTAEARFRRPPRPGVCAPRGGRTRSRRGSRCRRRWARRSAAGSPANVSAGPAPAGSTAFCALPAPPPTIRRCSEWPTVSMPACAPALAPCSPTTARAPPSPGSRPILAGSGWRACWPRSPSSICCAALPCRPACCAACIPTRSSASAGALRSRALGSCAGTPSASAWPF